MQSRDEMFDEIYYKPPLEACRELVALYDKGIHDTRDKLIEKEMTHRAIVALWDKILDMGARLASFNQGDLKDEDGRDRI